MSQINSLEQMLSILQTYGIKILALSDDKDTYLCTDPVGAVYTLVIGEKLKFPCDVNYGFITEDVEHVVNGENFPSAVTPVLEIKI